MCILLKVLKTFFLSKYFAFYVLFFKLLLLSPLRIVINICVRQGGNNNKIVEEGIKKIEEGK